MLEKISLRYDAIEDRVVLRLQTKAPSGAARRDLHITRRICSAWRADMAAMLRLAEQEPQSAYASQAAPARRPSAGALDLTASPVDAPAAENKAFAPSTPVALVCRINCARRRADGRWLLKFKMQGEGSFSLTLSDRALRDLMAGLQQQLKLTDWSLPPLADAADASKAVRARPLH